MRTPVHPPYFKIGGRGSKVKIFLSLFGKENCGCGDREGNRLKACAFLLKGNNFCSYTPLYAVICGTKIVLLCYIALHCQHKVQRKVMTGFLLALYFISLCSCREFYHTVSLFSPGTSLPNADSKLLKRQSPFGNKFPPSPTIITPFPPPTPPQSKNTRNNK